jgi:diadenosine tetraphosphatase ApaH/serine/threonine PP2A family protein phosphatase
VRYLIISDIHGNLEAFEAVLRDMAACRVETCYCLGDVVGYGPDPQACLERASTVCACLLRGNHEAALTDGEALAAMNAWAAASLLWTRRSLSADATATAAAWPLVRVEADVRFVHASPADPAAFPYIAGRRDAEQAFAACGEPVVFVGHTHQAMTWELAPGASVRPGQAGELALQADHRYLINVGSVGQPRDGDTRARWVLVDSDAARLVYRAVSYHVRRTQSKILSAGLPEILAARLGWGQ